MSSLRPCPGCSRHIQRIEDTCPFCSTDVIEGLAVRARQKRARAPLKWTLLGLAGAAPVVATVLVGRSGDAVPVYGAPPVPGPSFSVSSGEGPGQPPADARAKPEDAGAARVRKRPRHVRQ